MISDLTGRPNYFISENQAVQECYGLLAQYNFLYKLEFLFIMVLVLFVVFMLYKLYYRKFNKVAVKLEDLKKNFNKWERRKKKV